MDNGYPLHGGEGVLPAEELPAATEVPIGFHSNRSISAIAFVEASRRGAIVASVALGHLELATTNTASLEVHRVAFSLPSGSNDIFRRGDGRVDRDTKQHFQLRVAARKWKEQEFGTEGPAFQMTNSL